MSQQRPTRGRRVAKPKPRSFDRTALAAVVVLVIAALAVSVATREPTGEQGTSGTGSRPVDNIALGCPPRESATEILSASAPLPGLGDGGAVRHGTPGRVAEAQPQDVPRGVLRTLDAPGDGPVVLAAEGQIAAGLFAASVAADGSRTWASSCPEPEARWWFTGAGATLDHSSELVLTNLDPGPAVVDLRVFGQDGEVLDAPGARGITVEPGSSTRVPLIDIAPQQDDLAVEVAASRGRVVAAMSDSYATGLGTEAGVEEIPAQGAATRRVRLSGIPQQADGRTLVVANPGAREALVDVEISGASGSFAPTEGAQLRVPPGSVATTELAAPTGDEAVAVTLTSSGPVTATVRSTAAGDVSYAVPSTPLAGPAAAPVPAGTTATVHLTAGPSEAAAVVTAYDADGGDVASERVSLDPGATTTWQPGRRARYVVVSPQRGNVLGAVALGGNGVAQLPLDALPVRVEQPGVTPALG